MKSYTWTVVSLTAQSSCVDCKEHWLKGIKENMRSLKKILITSWLPFQWLTHCTSRLKHSIDFLFLSFLFCCSPCYHLWDYSEIENHSGILIIPNISFSTWKVVLFLSNVKKMIWFWEILSQISISFLNVLFWETRACCTMLKFLKKLS